MTKRQHSVANKTHQKIPRVPIHHILTTVLGKKYKLSIAFIGDTRMRTINRKNRNKDTTTNILSFPLSQNEGEVLISLPLAKKEARKNGMKESHYVGFLLIHGMLHLKGLPHGVQMEREEERLVKRFFGVSL